MVAGKADISSAQIADFCRRWGIGELALFGSVLRDDFGSESDVDVLYRMLPGRSYDFLGYFDMKDELEKMFGRPVDFVERKVIEESPNWVRRKAILSTAETIYAAG
jgi:uncharacterized protein